MSAERAYGCVLELRDELRRTYPLVDRRRLRSILGSHGFREFPDALMVAGAPWRGLVGEAFALARRVRAHGRPRRRTHPLFSEAFYLAAYPDVAAVQVDPWLHFQVLGRNEGRWPHPFVDPTEIARQMPGESPGVALDRYLTFPEYWMLRPGPYVDAEAFVMSGPWDARSHPLVQILRRYRVDPWVRGRLGMIDLASAGAPAHLAIGLLAQRNPGLAAISSVTIWTRSPSVAVPPPARVRVVPGFFLGGDGVELAGGGRQTMSTDGTVMRHRDVVVALDAGERRSCRRLVYLAGDVTSEELRTLASENGPEDLIAPATEEQAAVLAGWGVEILPLGRQVVVQAESVQVFGSAGGVAR